MQSLLRVEARVLDYVLELVVELVVAAGINVLEVVVMTVH